MSKLSELTAFVTRVLLDLAAPRLCIACAEPAGVSNVFCAGCAEQLEQREEPELLADGVVLVAPFAYLRPLSTAVRALKYEGRADLAAPLASLMGARGAGLLAGCDTLVPVPLHATRLAERGYNQAALLARQLTSRPGPRLDARALERVRATPQQAARSREERLCNVTGAFAVRNAERLRGRSIVLVDDVVTTGATALACIRALHTAGANVCGVLALARAGEPLRSL